MNKLLCYKTLAVWTKQTLPQAFMEKHNTKAGVWAKLAILKGELTFALLEENGTLLKEFHYSVTEQPPSLPPQTWHRIVSCSDDLECQLSFHCQPEDYYPLKYELTRTHSELIEASHLFQGGKALDVGCGRGRNALYLNLNGFDVTAWDQNENALSQLKQTIKDENLANIEVKTVNLNNDPFYGRYDWIVSTVVLMFLQPQSIPNVIKQMQSSTNIGGYNLIVSAMQSEDYPSPIDFAFLFSAGELREYYKEWEMIKYNEDVGQLHHTDENGNRIKLRFATLLARKKA